MRLEPLLLPHAADRGGTHAHALREPTGAPVGRALGGRQGLGQDALTHLPAVRPRAARVGRVVEPLEAPLLEPPAPQQNGRDGHVELARDLDVGGSIGRPQDDPGAHRHALLGGAGPRHGAQGLGFGLTHGQRGGGMGGHARHGTLSRPMNQAYCVARH